MSLPIILSVPHAGLMTPKDVRDMCILSMKDIINNSDEGAADIYRPLKPEFTGFVSTDIARAIVDVNRAEDDRFKDGVIKTHTCWDVPVYKEFPSAGGKNCLVHIRVAARVPGNGRTHEPGSPGFPVGPGRGFI